MSTQRFSSVKIPMFDRENYGLWKKKMVLFLQVANPKYLGVLKNGTKIPMVLELESIENDVVVVAARTYPKDVTPPTPGSRIRAVTVNPSMHTIFIYHNFYHNIVIRPLIIYHTSYNLKNEIKVLHTSFFYIILHHQYTPTWSYCNNIKVHTKVFNITLSLYIYFT